MIDCMAEGLLDIIQSRLSVSRVRRESMEYEWVKIYEGVKGNGNVIGINSGLEVCGNKLNIRTEKKIDKELILTSALRVIERFIRYFY